jgi:disulfide bond formation protein DsbB
MSMKNLPGSAVYPTASAVLVLAVAVILGALAFEHLGGYAPCPLCLQQRYAYYVSIPTLLVALLLNARGRPGEAAVLFAAVATLFLVNAGFAGYHAGAEWKVWPGPDTCAGEAALATGGGGLLKDLETTRVVRCDEAALHILGLSLAAWNVMICLLLAAGSAAAALAALPAPRHAAALKPPTAC